jgi:tetratricopeptide (TPR) repeat protein
VSRLRRLLAAYPEAGLATSARGYVLDTDPARVDLHRFRRLVREAREQEAAGGPEAAMGLLRSALALWRGHPLFADAAGRWLPDAVAPGLEEERLAAVEHLAALDLALGRPEAVAAELAPVVAEHPLRERLAGQLMTALHRAGRRAEALAVFRRVRGRFAEELGIEPGDEVQRVLQDVLAGRPAAPAPPAGAPAPPPVPRQLPPDAAPFTGREAELAALDALLADDRPAPGAPPVCVISGTGGVGKTALAVHWAHRARRAFPDGQLYVNLLGFGPGDLAREPGEAVRLFLDALGVPPDRVPASVDAQVGLYRSLLADRRVLVLLDNARDAGQVRPLLPNSPGCLVLVTSRAELTGLVAAEGARPLPLDLLPAGAARELLVRRLRPGQAGERAAVDAAVARCAGLPLALAIVAARARARPSFPLDALLTGLEEGLDGELDVFDGDDDGSRLRTVFSWSYRALSPDAARLFRLLGLAPAPEVTTAGAASLAAVPPHTARRLLTELTRAHLTTERSPGRYGMHDLLWAYARELAHGQEDAADRRAALGRLLDHHLYSAAGADALLDRYYRVPWAAAPAPPPPGVTPARVATGADAVAWFQRERPLLLGAVRLAAHRGFDAHTWRLACATRGFLSRHGHTDDQLETHRAALAAAGRLGDPTASAHAHLGLGQALIRLGDGAEGERHLRRALGLFGASGNPVGQAVAHVYLSVLEGWRQAYARAAAHNERARRLYRAAGDRAGEGRTMNNVGWYLARLGRDREALDRCTRAWAVNREVGDAPGESATLDSLGFVYHRLGRFEEAVDFYERSLRWRRDRERALAAETLGRLGEALRAAGRAAEGRRAQREALTLLGALAPAEASALRARLASPADAPA